MLLFLVPIFVKIFSQNGGTLPTLTQYIMDASDVIRDYWFVIFPAVGGSICGFLRFKKTSPGRALWDAFVLRVPMRIGDTVLKISMARVSRTLSTLLAAGVDIIKAIEITAHTSGNYVVEQALLDVKDRVQEGIPIAQPLLESDLFPVMISQMVKIGEETGELEQMLRKVADFYEDEVDTADRLADLDHRAHDDARRRRHGRRGRDLHVPADVPHAEADPLDRIESAENLRFSAAG